MGNKNEGGHIVLNLIARLQQIPAEIEPVRDPEAAAATRERLMAAFRDEHMVHVPVQATMAMPDEVSVDRDALRIVAQHDGEWDRHYAGNPFRPYRRRPDMTAVLELMSEGSPEGVTALPSRELGDTLST